MIKVDIQSGMEEVQSYDDLNEGAAGIMVARNKQYLFLVSVESPSFIEVRDVTTGKLRSFVKIEKPIEGRVHLSPSNPSLNLVIYKEPKLNDTAYKKIEVRKYTIADLIDEKQALQQYELFKKDSESQFIYNIEKLEFVSSPTDEILPCVMLKHGQDFFQSELKEVHG